MAQIRFGVRSEQGVTPYWKAKTSARGDVYLSSQLFPGERVHLSFHQAIEHWHAKIVRGNLVDRKPLHPAQLGPGLIRICSILLPAAQVASREVPKKVTWLSAPNSADSNAIRQVTLFKEDPWNGREDSWPGKRAMGNDLVGRLLLRTGVLTLVSHVAIVPPWNVSVDLSDRGDPEGARKKLVEDLTHPDTKALMWFVLDDGSTGVMAASGTVFKPTTRG